MKHLTLLFLLFTGISFAQDPRLFENQWYLTNLQISETDHIPPFNYMGIIFGQDSYVYIDDGCNTLFGATDFPVDSTNDFSFTVNGQTLLECMDRINYENLYFGFFSENNTLPHNFTYTISESENIKTLIINSMLNNHAIYSTQMLSTNQYQKLGFKITPNPVVDYLDIKFDVQSNENKKIEIVNGFGMLCKTLDTNDNQAKINCGTLSSGIYLFTVKNEKETITKKFIKL